MVRFSLAPCPPREALEHALLQVGRASGVCRRGGVRQMSRRSVGRGVALVHKGWWAAALLKFESRGPKTGEQGGRNGLPIGLGEAHGRHDRS